MTSGGFQLIRLVTLAAILLSVAAGCGSPKVEDVTAAFMKENPTVTVTSVASGEGDSDHAYMHIRYRRAGSSAECEVIWAYRNASRRWERFSKSEPSLPGTLCAGCIRKPCV